MFFYVNIIGINRELTVYNIFTNNYTGNCHANLYRFRQWNYGMDDYAKMFLRLLVPCYPIIVAMEHSHSTRMQSLIACKALYQYLQFYFCYATIRAVSSDEKNKN